MENIAFRPSGSANLAAVNATSVRITLPASINQDKQVRVTNPTNGVIYVKLGGSTVAAALGDYAIGAGQTDIISMMGAETHVAVFLTSGATDGAVPIARGEGS